MQKRTRNSFLSSSLSLLLVLQACTVNEPQRAEPYERGVIVLEEGQAQKGNASVTFLRPTNEVVTDIFRTTNQRPLGDVLRSYTEIDGKGYLVVSNSDKVEVVEASTFRAIAVIDKGLEQCRYVVAAPPKNDIFLKGYISYWGGKTLAPAVAVVSLADRKVIKQIPVGAGPEQMAVVGDQLFVTNSGGVEVGNTVTVINTTTDQVVAIIPVGDVPTSVVYDSAGGLLHVLCSGKPIYNSGGTTIAELVRINPVTRQVVNRVVLGGRPITSNPVNLVLHAATNRLYFLTKAGVYATPVGASSVPLDQPIIGRSLYGLGVDPVTGTIYGADARDRTGNGFVRRYQPTGTPVDSIAVGLIPNGFYFK